MFDWLRPDLGVFGWTFDLVLLKGTLILSVAGLTATLLWRASAAARHTVWATAMLVLAALPFLSAAWSFKSPASFHLVVEPSVSEVTATIDDPTRAIPVPLPTPQVSHYGRAFLTATSAEGRRTWELKGFDRGWLFLATAGVMTLWLAVLVTSLGRLSIHVARIISITRRSRPCGDPAVGALADGLAGQLRIREEIRVRLSNEIQVPMTWGAFRPAVLLPETAPSWDSGRLRSVLLHELAHVARRDYVFHLLTQAVRSLYWVNPLVWFAFRRIGRERERACDDFVLRAGTGSRQYAGHLLAMVASAQGHDRIPNAPLAMARRSTLAGRVKKVLDHRVDRRPSSTVLLTVVVLFATIGSLFLSSRDIFGISQLQESAAAGMRSALGNLQSLDPKVRRSAAWALGEIEATLALPELHQALDDPDPRVGTVAAWALGEIKDPHSMAPLSEALNDPDPLVREMAVLSLGEIERDEALRPILGALARDERLLGPTLWALGEIGTKEAHQAWVAVLTERRLWRPPENDEVWAGHLEEIDLPPRHQVPDLVARLSDPDPAVRRIAAQTLGCLDDVRGVEPLLDALADPDPTVRAMAVWALDEINPTVKG